MPIIDDDAFRVWEAGVREGVRGDPMFKFDAYRVALYLSAQATADAKRLRTKGGFPFQTDQLLRAAGSIAANIAEGLGRQSAAQKWLATKPAGTRLY